MNHQNNHSSLMDISGNLTEKINETNDSTNEKDLGLNWTGENISTLLTWVVNANYIIKCLDESICNLRQILRFNVILGLVLSTASGTISITNFRTLENSTVQLILNILFTSMTFIIAINTGRIKVYQIQERLEQFIKNKQDWTTFITSIATELQTPIPLRQDAKALILSNKSKYLELLKRDCEFTDSAKEKIRESLRREWQGWFILNKDRYNLHSSILSFNDGINIYDFLNTMLVYEGFNLIEAENQPDYHPTLDINVFLNRQQRKSNHDHLSRYEILKKFNEVVDNHNKSTGLRGMISSFLTHLSCQHSLNVEERKITRNTPKETQTDWFVQEEKEEKEEKEDIES